MPCWGVIAARLALILVAIAWSATPVVGFAQDPVSGERPLADALTVSGSDPCLEPASLARVAAVWLDRESVDTALRVVVDRGEVGATIVILSEQTLEGSRTFRELPSDCADRRAVVALAIALGIDAALLERVAPARAVEVPSTRVDHEEEDQEQPAPIDAVPPRPRGPRLAAELAIEAGVAIGLLGDVAAVGRGSLALHVDELRLDLAALGTSPDTQSLVGGRFEASLIAGAVDACLTHELAPLELVGCVGVAAGVLQARGHGYAEDREVQLAWLAGLARIEGVSWIADLLGIVVSVEGLVPFVRPAPTVVASTGEVLDVVTLPVVALTLTGGFRFRFR